MSVAHKAVMLLALLCTPLSGLAQGAAGPARGGGEFRSPDCRCSAGFPGPSKSSPREGKTPDGRTVVTQFQEFSQGKRYFAVSWLQLPGAPKDAAAEKRLLETAAAGALKANAGGKLLYKRNASVSGVPGLAYAIDLAKDNTRVRQRIFVVGDRLVEQTYSGPTGSETGPEVERFVGSLKLVP